MHETQANLAARLESAAEGSRKLSDEVLLALGWKLKMAATSEDLNWFEPVPKAHGYTLYAGQMYKIGEQPDPTRSVDDAIALISKDWKRGVLAWPGYENGELINKALATLRHECWSNGGPCVTAFASTPALALSAALVRAIAS